MKKKVLSIVNNIEKGEKHFTDREIPRDLFNNELQKMVTSVQTPGFYESDDFDPSVISFFGIGGKGKTTLLHQLEMDMKEIDKSIPSVFVDFEKLSGKQAILEHIQEILEREYKFVFPIFSLALFYLAKKSGENVDEIKKTTLYKSHPLVKSLIDITGAFVQPIQQSVTIIDSLSGLIDDRFSDKILVNDCIRHMKDEKATINKLSVMDSQEIVKKLHEYFTLDLAANLSNQKDKKPLVFLFDTYEKFIDYINYGNVVIVEDKWIQDIVASIPGIIWVFAGREYIRWDKYDEEWKSVIKINELTEFEFKDADKYLSEAGIDDPSLRSKLIYLTEGIPFYLSICVDNYYEASEDERSNYKKIFGKNKTELIRRYASYIPNPCKDIFYLITCLGVFNDSIITHLSSKLFPGFQKTSYDTIKDLSVISYDKKHKHYLLNRTVADTLCSTWDSPSKEEALDYIISYMKELMDKCTVNDPNLGMYISIMVRAGIIKYKKDEDKDKVYQYFENEIVRYLDRLAVLYRPDMIDSILRDLASSEVIPEKSYFEARVGTYYIQAFWIKGDIERAKLSAEYVGQYFVNNGDTNYITSLKSLNTLVDILNRTGEYKKALDFSSHSYKILKEHENDIDIRLYLKTVYAYCDALFYMGRYEEAKEILKEGMQRGEKDLGNEDVDVLWLMNELAIMCADTGDHTQALSYQEKIFSVRKEKLGEDNPSTLWAEHNLANSYEDMGEYQKSLDLREDILRKRIETQGDTHPDTIWAYHSRAKSLAWLGDIEKAIEELKKVNEYRQTHLGPDNPDTWWGMHTLSKIYLRSKNYAEAEPMLTTLLEKRRNKYGEKHPYTVTTLYLLAQSKENLGNINEAHELYQTMYGIRKDLYGEDHPDTIAAYELYKKTENC